MSRYWEIETQLDDNTNVTGNGDLDYEVYGKIAILLNKYVRKEEGKGLSTNDFNNEYRAKLDGIEDNAQVNVLETISINEGVPIHADENKNIDITIPTKVSELENDENYVTQDELDDIFLNDNIDIGQNLTVHGTTTLMDDVSVTDNADLSLDVGSILIENDGNTTFSNDGDISLSNDGDMTLSINGVTTETFEGLKTTNLTNGEVKNGDTTQNGDFIINGKIIVGDIE